MLSVLGGECTVAEPARRNKCSETSMAKWRDQFLNAHAPWKRGQNRWHESPHHSRYLCKHLSSAKAFRGRCAKFTNPPVDLHQLAVVLTAKGHSLESGCEAFEVLMPERRRPPTEHYDPPQTDPGKRYGNHKAKAPFGKSPHLITYCRGDVLASQLW